ncbi:glycosyltransferase, partial [Sphaerotilus natans]
LMQSPWVTYSPDDEVAGRLRAIATQVDHVLVVDNTPARATFPALGSNVSVLFNENRGAISGALNEGMRHARANGFTHMVLFDQDTEIPPGLCGRLLDASRTRPDAALIGPRYLNSSTGHPGRIVSLQGFWRRSLWPVETEPAFEALFLINSCSLLRIDRIPAELRYDEGLIVDNVDVDFCLALRSHERTIWCIPSITVSHGIGARKKGAGKWSPTNYSPLRKYLQSKNRVIVWRRYLTHHPGFVLQDILVWFLDSARTVVLETGRLRKLGAILKGFVEGWAAPGSRLARD